MRQATYKMGLEHDFLERKQRKHQRLMGYNKKSMVAGLKMILEEKDVRVSATKTMMSALN